MHLAKGKDIHNNSKRYCYSNIYSFFSAIVIIYMFGKSRVTLNPKLIITV